MRVVKFFIFINAVRIQNQGAQVLEAKMKKIFLILDPRHVETRRR